MKFKIVKVTAFVSLALLITGCNLVTGILTGGSSDLENQQESSQTQEIQLELDEAESTNLEETKLLDSTEDIAKLTNQAVAEAARLTPEQVIELRKISERHKDEYIAKPGVIVKIKPEVIVPTYLPEGFKPSISENDYGYRIIYKNDSYNTCFLINITHYGAASGEGYEYREVSNSKVFGKVGLTYTTFSNASDTPIIATAIRAGDDIDWNHWTYYFQTPLQTPLGVAGLDVPFAENVDCDEISLAESVKIIESLEYLYSDHRTDLVFSSEF